MFYYFFFFLNSREGSCLRSIRSRKLLRFSILEFFDCERSFYFSSLPFTLFSKIKFRVRTHWIFFHLPFPPSVLHFIKHSLPETFFFNLQKFSVIFARLTENQEVFFSPKIRQLLRINFKGGKAYFFSESPMYLHSLTRLSRARN